MSTELDLNGHTYRIGPLDARAQFHIVRRLAPIIGTLAPMIGAKSDAGELETFAALASALAKLSDEESDYCVFGLLKVVQRKQVNGLGWGPVCAGTSLMYEDITMADMLHLAWHAARVNLAGFFAALPSDLKGAIRTASDPLPG